jgi:hypothetical protein
MTAETRSTYRVVATRPTAGPGSSMDSREVGPFESRRLAEEAASRMVDDPRRWGRIEVEEVAP